MVPADPILPEAPASGTHSVERVISGDVVVLEDIGPARLLGVDARLGPTGKPLDLDRSRSFLQTLVTGKKVTVEFDPATANSSFKDEIDLPLVYLTLDDGTFVNRELIARGIATVDLTAPSRRGRPHSSRAGSTVGDGAFGRLLAPPPQRATNTPPPVIIPPRPTRVPSPIEVPKPAPPKDAVLVTSDGRFHRQSCSLSKSGAAMSVQDARGKHYLACPSCFASSRVKV